MRFALLHEADDPLGRPLGIRFREMADEAVAAEQAGFDVYALSEQHFLPEVATCSAPEVIFGYVAARTERIRMRFTSAVLLSFNHPIRVAERLATLDQLTDGRAELGTARSNNFHMLEGFGVDPKTTRQQWRESLEVIVKALTEDPFEYHGELWDIPPKHLVPPAVQKPHPPLFVSASSEETHRTAGHLGIGVMTGSSILGWEWVQRNVDAYWEAAKDVQPLAGQVTHSAAMGIFAAHCADTTEEARREAERACRAFVELNIGEGGLYEKLGPTSPDYEYLTHIEEMKQRKGDLDYVIEAAPYIGYGTPDWWHERISRLRDMGYTEVLLRIDGMGHDVNMKAIRNFGRHVIPAFS